MQIQTYTLLFLFLNGVMVIFVDIRGGFNSYLISAHKFDVIGEVKRRKCEDIANLVRSKRRKLI